MKNKVEAIEKNSVEFLFFKLKRFYASEIHNQKINSYSLLQKEIARVSSVYLLKSSSKK